ncbi:MAG: hypothetical protein ACI8PZ_003018 [Myxococcota bacterium]|jgi:hypothetical protein
MRGWVVLVLVGCSGEIGFSGNKPAEAPVDTGTPPVVTTPTLGAPDIDVTPTAIDLPGVCDNGSTTLTVANLGVADLEIGAVLTTGGWSVTGGWPAVVAPGDSLPLELLTLGGAGTVTVHSNDPDEPAVEVPLDTSEDTPPVISLLLPPDGVTLPASVPIEIHARVSDEETPAEELVVEWWSSEDGYVANTPPDAAGEAIGEWRWPRSDSWHDLTVTVTDSCGQEADQSVRVCQQKGFDEGALDLEQWVFSGSAQWDMLNEWIELTDDQTGLVGSAFTTEISVDGANVEIDFLFYIGDGSGADGISLTALDTNRAVSFLGGDGCGIGYGGDAPCTAGPALPGWSIEIDTYYNAGQDPTAEDHIMFTFNGDVDDPAIWAELPEMEDTGWHTMKVLVAAPHVLAEVDGVPYIDADLVGGSFAFPALIGFTAGTGALTNYHLIDELVVTEFICP